KTSISEIDAILVEDYGKGFLAPELVSRIVQLARDQKKIVAADPSPRHNIAWHGLSVVKPNRSEAFHAAGIPWTEPTDSVADDEALQKVGEALMERWDTQLLLITLGEQGMMLFQRGQTTHHVPTKARQVFDV